MSTPKKRRAAAERRAKRKQRARETKQGRASVVRARAVKPDIHREIGYITRLAQAEDSRVVLGELVLFSTRTRDAWLLDRQDGLALCLCRDGEPQPFRVVDTPESFGIEWSASFTIDGAAFIVHERSGRTVVIHGYPTLELAAACRA
jgi:hypothetical protein